MSIARTISAFAAGIASFALAAPAHAAWRVAETEHFVYYSESSPEDLKDTVTRMEMFDTLVRALTGNTRPSSPLKVQMFEVPDMNEVNRIAYSSGGIGGFYSNSEQGPYLITFRNNKRDSASAFRAGNTADIWAPEVRQHEYLHHYMYQYFNTNYPAWYTEGFAEYYGTMAFPEPNVAEIGHAPYYRLDAIRNGFWVDTEKLLSARTPGELREMGYAVYTQGWLLTHLAATNPERGKQLKDYLNRLTHGESYGAAAKAAFGDVKQLDKDLHEEAKHLNATRLSLKPMNIGPVKITELSPLDSALVTYKMRLMVGIDKGDYSVMRQNVRELRKANPNDLMGLEMQARLAIEDEDYADAQAMAEQMLEVDQASATAKDLLGYAKVRAIKLGSPSSEYDPARRLIAEAAKADPENPEPLVHFYMSYLLTDTIPPETAQAGLMKAHELAPGYPYTTELLARDFEARGMIDDAIFMIKPLAYATFEGSESEQAKRKRAFAKAVDKYGRLVVPETAADMLRRLEAKKDGRYDEKTGKITPKPGEEAASASPAK
jgi:tetratricopeptide (TPR) repeat protein